MCVCIVFIVMVLCCIVFMLCLFVCLSVSLFQVPVCLFDFGVRVSPCLGFLFLVACCVCVFDVLFHFRCLIDACCCHAVLCLGSQYLV